MLEFFYSVMKIISFTNNQANSENNNVPFINQCHSGGCNLFTRTSLNYNHNPIIHNFLTETNTQTINDLRTSNISKCKH